jgi:PAS domain S-box-containing protein
MRSRAAIRREFRHNVRSVIQPNSLPPREPIRRKALQIRSRKPSQPPGQEIAGKSDISADSRENPSAAREEVHALTAELERYRLAVLASHEGLWDWDLATGEIWYSPQILDILGWESEAANGAAKPTVSNEAWMASVHPEDYDRLTAAIASHLEQNTAYDVEYRFRRPNGEYRWLRSTGRAMREESGKPTRMLGAISDITERKLADQALRHSQAESEAARKYLDDALNSMRDGFGIWDAEERLIMCNEPFRTLAGKAAHLYVPGLRFEDIIREGAELGQWWLDDGGVEGFVDARLAKFRAGERYELKRANGTWMEAYDHKTADGRTISYRVDITERKRAEEAVRRSEANLKEAQQISQVGNWEMVEDGGKNRPDELSVDEVWSDEYYRIFGRERDSFPASFDNFLACVHPDDRELVRAEMTRGLAAGGPFSYRHRIVRPDGEVRHVLERVVPRKGADGSIVGRAGTTQDITDQVEADEAMRDSEFRLREAQRISNIGDWESIGASDKRRWSDEIYRILGRDPESLEPDYNSFIACIHPDDRKRVEATIKKGMASGKPFSFEHRIVRPDGSVRHILQRAVPRCDGHGELGRAGTIQDITESKEMEERLQQAQKMEVVGQLTGGIAHDFNNLLTVIMGNFELLREFVEVDEATEELIDRGLRAAERGADLTHRLLAFSRRQTLLPVAIDLNLLIAGMIEMLRRTLGETITISTREPADLWLCEADQSQLENALLNLAVNARDAMPGGGKLTIETDNVEIGSERADVLDIEPGAYVMLSAKDTGYGISSDLLDHVFEPFFTTKEVGKGSGLGLSMIYGFVRQSGGTVTIESEAGVGTAVTLYLPRATEGAVRGMESLSQIEVMRGKGERILVVEDDPDVRDQAVNLLLTLGHRAYPAESGQAALNLLSEGPPFDLLLSDVVLPDLNGPALAEAVRHRDPEIVVVFMTGYARGAFEHHAEEGKVTRLLNKPFSKAELSRTIYDALRRL